MKKDVEVIAIRLQPGEDLKQSLLAYCIHQKIEAAYMLSCVGSLRRAAIRFANKPEETVFEQPLEIVSLEGTISQHGVHLHIAVSDSEGQVIGGHLMSGSNIYTTAEIVFGIVPNTIFKREIDPLVVQKTLLPPVDSLIMRTSPPLRTQSVTLGTAESTSWHRLSGDFVAGVG